MEDSLWMRNFCRSLGALILSGFCLRVCASMVFSSDFPILMSLFGWFAWRAHPLWILPAHVRPGVAIHVFFSEPEVPRPMFFQLAYLVSEAPMCGH